MQLTGRGMERHQAGTATKSMRSMMQRVTMAVMQPALMMAETMKDGCFDLNFPSHKRNTST